MTAALMGWMGMHAMPCLANDTASSSAADAKAIYVAFLTQWMGKDDAPTNVADTAKQPTPDDIGHYTQCAGSDESGSIRWVSGTTDADLRNAIGSLARVKLVAPAQWQAVDPSDLIAHGRSADAAVEAGFAGGLMTLSAISFNQAHDVALFTFSFECGRLCGHGGTVMFTKTPRGWVQDRRSCDSWMS